MRKKTTSEAGEFKAINNFINRMFAASGDVGRVVDEFEKELPRLAETINAEHSDITILMDALARLNESNSLAQALAGTLMEAGDDLTAAKHNMRQLATISQLTPVLAQTSPEFIRDVLTTVDKGVLAEALDLVDVETFEKLLGALNAK